MKGKCTRGFGIIEDPETGEEINVEDEFEVSEDVFERLKETYPGIEAVPQNETQTDTETSTETESPEAETFRCGVNDCSRTVDSPEAVCWQHK
jgi:hypothetical protein